MSDTTPATVEPLVLPRRIEVESLLPGDVFEYEHRWRVRYPDRVEKRSILKRDTVLVRDDADYQHIKTGTGYFKFPGHPAVEVFTEIGENSHGYVILPAKTVVVLIERTAPMRQTDSDTAEKES